MFLEYFHNVIRQPSYIDKNIIELLDKNFMEIIIPKNAAKSN